MAEVGKGRMNGEQGREVGVSVKWQQSVCVWGGRVFVLCLSLDCVIVNPGYDNRAIVLRDSSTGGK